ncbi:vacuolar protein sorting-associated protein 13c isoform related protein [Cyclospora cayetanensis]|uniref:Vacuolar protein sorting-associated protein 13c isoform related protein n=1 Tax=Cyclospora cayetanensis TaxID=88456 RepID=A0A1D3D8D8_9EIME|nr:vacuolar protein sorting-associated protein 13c isoform related protein [Cyclospora cayetanensis]
MHASLEYCTRQDYAGEDNAEWAFSFSLSDFSVKQKDHILMQFRSEAEDGSSSSTDGGGGNYGRTRVGLFGESGKVIRLPSAILRLAPTSLSAAQFLLKHQLTPKGNILLVCIRLAPIVATVRPDILKTLCAFFVFETPADVLRLQSVGASSSSFRELPEEAKKATTEDTDALLQGGGEAFLSAPRLREKGETVYAAAVHRLPALLQLELSISAPIFLFDSLAAGSVSVHLGTLALTTDGPCPYDSLSGSLELNETRILCAPKGAKEVSLLRPIPIRVKFQAEKMQHFSLDVIFQEIFLEATPEAVALLLAAPVSIAKSVLMQQSVPSTPEDAFDSGLVGKAAATVGISSEDHTLAYAAESALQAVKGLPASLRDTAASGSADSNSLEEEKGGGLTFESTWRFGRCGFIVHCSSNSEAKGVLQAQLEGFELIAGGNTKEGTYCINASLRQIEDSLERCSTALSQASASAPLHLDSFEDALEDSFEISSAQEEAESCSLRMRVTHKQAGDPQTSVSLFLLPGELHWRQHSLRRIIDTVQVYREQLGHQLAIATSTFTRRPFFSDAAFAAFQEALHAMQSSLVREGSTGVETEVSLECGAQSGRPTGSGNPADGGDGKCLLSDGTIGGIPWMRKGLDVGGAMPPLAAQYVQEATLQQEEKQQERSTTTTAAASSACYSDRSKGSSKGLLPVAVALELAVEGASLAFWEGRALRGRVGVRGVGASVATYGNGDVDASLSIQDAAVILSGPLKIRRYGGGHPLTGATLPFSMAISGRVNQLCLVYIQQDISGILDYLRDGIFDLFVSRSYAAVKQAATATPSLLALHIDCPLFIFPENKAAIPELVDPRQETPVCSASDEAASVALAAYPGRRVDVEGLGRYFVFAAGILKVRNAYVPLCSEAFDDAFEEGLLHRRGVTPAGSDPAAPQMREKNRRNPLRTASAAASITDDAESKHLLRRSYRTAESAEEESGSGSGLALDLSLDFSGTQLLAQDNKAGEGGSTETVKEREGERRSGRTAVSPRGRSAGCFVEGRVLETAEIGVRLQAATGRLAVAIETSPWLLQLSREQLTLLLDVVNENLAGSGYRVASGEPSAAARAPESSSGRGGGDAAAAALTWNDAGKGGGGGESSAPLPTVLQEAPLPSVPSPSPPLQHMTVRLFIPQLLLQTAYSADAPLARLTVHRIGVSASVSDAPGTTQMQLHFTGDVFALDDLRKHTRNFYRRLAHCVRGAADHKGSPAAGGSTASKRLVLGDVGEISDCTDSTSGDSSGDEGIRSPALSMRLKSGREKTALDVELTGVTLYALVVGFTDIGQFVVYTDLESPTAPLLVWSGDFDVRLVSSGSALTLQKLQIQRSKICRLEAAPFSGIAGAAAASALEGSSSSSSSSSTYPSFDFMKTTTSAGLGGVSCLSLAEQFKRGGEAGLVLGGAPNKTRGPSTSLSPRSETVPSPQAEEAQQRSQAQEHDESAEEFAGKGSEFLLGGGETLQVSRLVPSMSTEGAVLLCEDLSVSGSGLRIALATEAELLQRQAEGGAQEEESLEEEDPYDAEEKCAVTTSPRHPPTAPRTIQRRTAAERAGNAAAAAGTPLGRRSVDDMKLSGSLIRAAGDSAVDGQEEPLITKERLQLSIPRFSLRVSSNDIALLLQAARGITADGPSVCLPFLPTAGHVEAATSEGPRSHAEAFSTPRQPLESGSARGEEASPPSGEEQPNSSSGVLRDVRVSVELAGIDLLLLDDLRASVLPLVQARLAIRQLTARILHRRITVALKDLQCGCDFLNHIHQGPSKDESLSRSASNLSNTTPLSGRDAHNDIRERRISSRGADPWSDHKEQQRPQDGSSSTSTLHTETTGGVMVLQQGGSTSLPLEALMKGQTAEDSRSAHTRQQVFLAFCPPVAVLQQVREVLPQAVPAAILRSLLLTGDPARTVNDLLASNNPPCSEQEQQQEEACIGAFPRGMQAVLVDAMKSRCVSLLQPLQQRQHPQRTSWYSSGVGEAREHVRAAPQSGKPLQKMPPTPLPATRTLGSPVKQLHQRGSSAACDTGSPDSGDAAEPAISKHGAFAECFAETFFSEATSELVGQVLKHPDTTSEAKQAFSDPVSLDPLLTKPPQWMLERDRHALLGPGWAFVCFRPAAFAAAPPKETTGQMEVDPPQPPDMRPLCGWSSVLDTRQSSYNPRCSQCAYLPPAHRHDASKAHALDASESAEEEIKEGKNLFFRLLSEEHKTALPAERLLRSLTIFPALTLVNATLIELDVYISLSGSSSPQTHRTASGQPPPVPPAATVLQKLQILQQRPFLSATLTRQSVFYVYEVPSHKALALSLKFSVLEGALWSPALKDFLSVEEGLVSRLLVPSRAYAPVELEVLRDAAEVFPYVPSISPKELVAVISAPRLFVDRTGLKIKPIQGGRYFPDFGGYSLLGDSTLFCGLPPHEGLILSSGSLIFPLFPYRGSCAAGRVEATHGQKEGLLMQ